MILRGVALAAFLVVGCYQPSAEDCAYTCEQGACPAGLTCTSGFCRAPNASGTCTAPVDVRVDTVVPTSGLVLWYAMETLASDIVSDTSGNGHTAQCPMDQCPVVAPGAVDNGYRFDGVDDILVVAPAAELNTPLGYTVSLWINLESEPAGAPWCPVNKGLGSDGNSWQVCVQGNLKVVHMTEGIDLYEGPVITLGTWYHVAIRWDMIEKTTWLDGKRERTDARTMTNFDNQTITVGADVNNMQTAGPWPGMIDEVRVYSRALTSDDIAALATP